MPWTVSFLNERVEAEMEEQSNDIRARFDRMRELIVEHGPALLPSSYAKHIAGPMWELRMKGRDGIARAFYVTASGRRLVIVRVFTKKTQKTPQHEIKLALKRAEGVT
jgi:phage-related protein